MEKEPKNPLAKKLVAWAEEMLMLAENIEERKTTALNPELQPIIKAIFDLNQRIDDLENRVDKIDRRRSLPDPESEVKPVEVFYKEPEEESDESLSTKDHYMMLIRKALERHGGNRKLAAEELGMSERTLYRHLPPEYRKPWKRSKED